MIKKQKINKNMVLNFIFTVLILFLGAYISFAVIPLFGVMFLKDDSESQHGEDLNSDVSLWDFIKIFPVWLLALSLLVFQACVVFVIHLWLPSLFDGCEWILRLSIFLGFFAIILYVILINIVDDFGKIKWFKKKK